MKNYVKGKVIIITGAANGFGKATAKKVAAMEGKIVCVDLNEDGVMAVVEELKKNGGEAIGVKVDVTDRDQVNAMAKAAIDAYGRIDVLINNAGIMPLAFFAEHEHAWKAWDKCFDINLKGVVYGICAVYDQMMKQERGQIINISSIYANHPVVGSGVYQATKVGVEYLTRTLLQEATGIIKASCVKPTGVPSTGLFSTMVNSDAAIGALGQNAIKGLTLHQELPGRPDLMDRENTKYLYINGDDMAESIIYLINQPWGINISDITVRSSYEQLVL